MSDGSLEVGFVGAGVIAWAHALAIRSMVKAEVVNAHVGAVFDSDGDKSASFASSHGIVAAASALEVADRCDAVFVCTPTGSHLEAVEAVASSGRALFCEKPLGRDLRESEQIVAVARSAGLHTQVGLVLRTAPVFVALAALVRDGSLGRPMAVQFRDDQFFPIQGHYASTWRSDRDIAGSGALLEHSIHDLDILGVCLGEVVSVSAQTGNYARYEGIEDVAAGVLRFASGTLGTLVSVWHQVLSRPSTRRVEVLFDSGVATFDDDFSGPLQLQTSAGTEVRECPPPGWVSRLPLPDDARGIAVRAYAEQDRAFLDAVASGTMPSPGLAEALLAHRLVDAWYRSAASGGSPTIPGASEP